MATAGAASAVSATAVAVVAAAAAAPVDFRNSRRSIEHPLGKACAHQSPSGRHLQPARAWGDRASAGTTDWLEMEL
jgi:hypothetical protein